MGEGAPSLDKGGNGDYYIDRLLGLLYGPKSEQYGWGTNPIRLINENQLGNNTIISGKGAPDMAQGNVGDLYLDTQNQKLYGPKTEASWGSGYVLGNKNVKPQEDKWPNYRLSKDEKTLLAWVNQRTVQIDMRTDAKLNKITTIAKEAFTPAYALTSIIISESVTSIGSSAFSELPFLETVTIPSSLKKVPRGLFNQCIRLSAVNLSEGIEEIDGFAFSDLSLAKVTIPKTTKKIGEAAFTNNEKLIALKLQEGLVNIGSMAFSNCKELPYLEIPASVKTIGRDAFADCENVTVLVLHGKGLPRWSPEVLDDFSNLKELYVPDESLAKYKKSEDWNYLFEGENATIQLKPLSKKPKN